MDSIIQGIDGPQQQSHLYLKSFKIDYISSKCVSLALVLKIFFWGGGYLFIIFFNF